MIQMCGASCTSPALPTQVITSASTMGSMPAGAPVRSDRPTTPVPPALLMGTENVTAVALLSNGTGLAIVFRLLRRWCSRAGVLTDSYSPQAAFPGLRRRQRAHDTPNTGSGPVVGGVGEEGVDLASRGRRGARTAVRRQCVALAEREAKSGDASEATAEPNITVAAPDGVPWGQGQDLTTHYIARFAHHIRFDAPHPGVRVTLPAGRVTLERTWIGARVTLDRHSTRATVTFNRL